MNDEKTDRGPNDPSRVNMTEDYEVAYWTRALGVSKERLAVAVEMAGSSAEAVKKHLMGK
jgi:hypothetical protein